MAQGGAANSGTPFRQIQEWCAGHGKSFNYRVLGISRHANTPALFDRADALGVRYRLDDFLQVEVVAQRALQALGQDRAQCDGVYLTLDRDALSWAVAPGGGACPVGQRKAARGRCGRTEPGLQTRRPDRQSGRAPGGAHRPRLCKVIGATPLGAMLFLLPA